MDRTAESDGQPSASFGEMLAEFKRDCNEDELIIDLMRSKFKRFLVEPILDVGAGSGEIAEAAFPHCRALLLDVEAYPPPPNRRHRREIGDFLTFDPSSMRPTTILLCHVTYYFSRQQLMTRLSELKPEFVIIVANEETPCLVHMRRWASSNVIDSPSKGTTRPWFHLLDLSTRRAFVLHERTSFIAELRCKDFRRLATRFVSVLLGLEPTTANIAAAENALRSLLPIPATKIVEAIYCYRRMA
jgi:hypothetical protein